MLITAKQRCCFAATEPQGSLKIDFISVVTNNYTKIIKTVYVIKVFFFFFLFFFFFFVLKLENNFEILVTLKH